MSEGPSSSLMLYFFSIGGNSRFYFFFSREVFVCVFFLYMAKWTVILTRSSPSYFNTTIVHFFRFLETLCIKITHVINCLVFLSDFWVFQSGGFSFSSRSIHAPMFVDYKYFEGFENTSVTR